MTYHRALRPADARSCASSTRTARGCGRPTAGSSRTSSRRRSTASRSRSTATGTQTRSFCYVDDEVRGHPRAVRLRRRRAGEHRQPRRVHDARARRASCARSPARRPRSCSSRCPIGDPTRRRPDITRARDAARLGADDRAARGSRAHARLVPGGAGPWPSVITARRRSCASSRSIVPVFNERNTVVEIVRRMRAVELPDGIEREIIVVDDGSDDGTRDVLQPARRQHRARRHARRATGARARRCAPGFEHVTGDYVLVQDADLEYDPEDWPQAARAGAPRARRGSCTARASPVSAATCCSCTGSATGSCRSSRTCSTTRRSPTWRRATSSSTATLLLDARAAMPTASTSSRRSPPRSCKRGDPHLRGADLVHRPRVRRGQEDHVARRLRGAVDAREVPLRRLSRARDRRAALGGGRRQLRSRAAARPSASRRCSPTRARAPVELVVVDNGSRDGSVADARTRAFPTCTVVARAGQRRVRARREPRHRRDPRADRRGAEPRHRRSSRAPRRRCVGRFDARAAARGACGPRLRNPDGSDYPSARIVAVGRRRGRCTALLGLWWPTNRFTARYRQLDADPDAAAAVDWVSGAAVWLRRARARRRRRLGRALLHVPRGRRPVLAAAARRLGRRVRAGRRRRARAGREHRRAARTGCSSSTTGRRGGSPAAGSPARGPLLLPFAAVFLGRARRRGDGRAAPGARRRTSDRPPGSLARHGAKPLGQKRARRSSESAREARGSSWCWYALTAVVVVAGVALDRGQP